MEVQHEQAANPPPASKPCRGPDSGRRGRHRRAGRDPGGRPGPGRAGRACPGAPSQDRQPGSGQPGRRAGQGGGARPGLADTRPPRRFFQPEPPMDTGPRLDADEQLAPAPPPPPPSGRMAWSSAWPSPPCSWRLSPPRPGGSTTAAPDPSRHLSGRHGHPARSAGRGRRPTRRPRPALATAKRWRCGPARRMLRPDVPGGRNPVRTAKGFRVACLALGLALVAVGCAGPERDAGGDGVRGGTLRVLSADPDVRLDTADTVAAPRSPAPTPGPCTATTSPDHPSRRPSRSPTSPAAHPALGRPAHLHLHPAPRGPLRPPGQPRGHRPGLHHRHPAALRQEVPLVRAAVLGPHRRGQQRSAPARPAASRA